MMMVMMMMTRTTMPRGPDLNLNAAPLLSNESVREFVKQAMLQHEIAFRHQVRELHRLYWTQRNLMSELRGRTMPNSEHVTSDEIGFSLDSPRPFNLELPADHEYINRRSQVKTWHDEEKKASRHFAVESGSALVCGDVCDLGKSVTSDRNDYEKRRQQQQQTTHPLAEPRGFNGACSIDHSTQKNQSISSKLMLIDLNETLDDESSGAWHNPVCAIASSSSMNSAVIQCGASSNSHATTHQYMPFWRESSNQCPEGIPVGVKSGSSHLASDFTRESNTINSFHGFQDSQISAALAATHNLETTTEDFTYQKQPRVANLAHSSVLEAPPDPQRKPTSESSGDTVHSVQINVNGTVPSVSGSFAVDSKDAEVHGDSRKQAPPLTHNDDIEGTNLHASVGSTNLPPTVSRGSGDKKHNHEGSEEDTLCSHTIARGVEHREACSKEVPFLSKYELVVSVNNDSTSGDRCIQKHTVPFIAEESGMTHIESLVSESYPNKQSPVAEAFDCCSVQTGSCNIGKQKCLDHAGNDSFIFTAAEALVLISLGKPECFADQFSGFGHIELDADESEEPQRSSDSFESLTLMLPESKIDQYRPMPVTPTQKAKENNACRVKLRRGRGLRDFQKDILPGLVSLSRHEICEDLHTIESALRKCRTETSVNWLIPVRNRRSRRLSTNSKC